MLAIYRAPAVSYRCRSEIEKSIFIADIAPVDSMEEAQSFWDARRKEFRGATHHCFACRIGTGQIWEKSSDDGEPQGTAGHPMLGVLQKKRLTHTVLVVTRYFGGVKLGAGGLARAYGGAASQAASSCEILSWTPHIRVDFTFSYPLVGLMENELAGTDIITVSRSFADTVQFTLLFPSDTYAARLKRFTDMTAGQLTINEQGEEYVPLKEY